MQLSGWHWSSSQGNGSGEAWTFYFHDGGLDSAPRGFSRHVRALCVLSSPPEPVLNRLTTTNDSGKEPPASPAVPSSALLNNAVSSGPAHSAETETAVLHVYRLKHFAGSAISYGVYIDGTKISSIRNAQTFRVPLPAGKHSISVSVRGAKTRKPINDFDMAAGKEYWVRVDLGAGFPMDYFIVSLIADDQAEAESRQLEEIKISDLSKK